MDVDITLEDMIKLAVKELFDKLSPEIKTLLKPLQKGSE